MKDRARPSASARGYDVKWRRVRAQFLRHHPLCIGSEQEPCNQAATEVDHIIPLVEGGTHQWSNLQPFCKSCHSKKTVRENRGKGGQLQPRRRAAR